MLLQILSIASASLGLLILILNALHNSKLAALQADLAEIKDLIDGVSKPAAPQA